MMSVAGIVFCFSGCLVWTVFASFCRAHWEDMSAKMGDSFSLSHGAYVGSPDADCLRRARVLHDTLFKGSQKAPAPKEREVAQSGNSVRPHLAHSHACGVCSLCSTPVHLLVPPCPFLHFLCLQGKGKGKRGGNHGSSSWEGHNSNWKNSGNSNWKSDHKRQASWGSDSHAKRNCFNCGQSGHFADSCTKRKRVA